MGLFDKLFAVFFFRNVSTLTQGAERHKDSEKICIFALVLR